MPEPADLADAVDAGVSSYLTPNAEFYRIDTALSSPRVDPAGWRLRVHGMVDTPFTIGYEELLSMDSVEEVVTLQCVSNEVGDGLVGNAVWQGVPLRARSRCSRHRSTAGPAGSPSPRSPTTGRCSSPTP